MAQAPNVFTTPKGIAQYPWLSKPDTKFNEEGEYKVNLVLTKEDAAPIIEQINAAFSENLKEEVKKNDGKPTGNVIIKFKSKALYPPAIFDAKGDVMKDSNIWGGSEIRVNGSIAPYYVKLIGAGVALRLRAVQVIQYVEGGTGSADRFGFEEVDGGFVQEAPAKEVSPEIKSEEAFDEPTVRETKPALDNTDDISGIINKWGQA